MYDGDEEDEGILAMDGDKLAEAVLVDKMKRMGETQEHDADVFSSMAVLPDLGGPDKDELLLFRNTELMASLSPGELSLRAAEHGQLDVLKGVLTSHPLAVHTTDTDGYTPLHRASYGGHTECAAFLLSSGANPNALTGENWTPLHSACRWSKWQCAALLLQNGADINALSNGGQTPLHLAATTRQADHDLFQVILADRRLDASLKNNLGDTACDLAVRESTYADMMDAVEDCLDVPVNLL